MLEDLRGLLWVLAWLSTEGSWAGNDRNQGAGKSWGADTAQEGVGVPSEAAENFPY